VIKKINQVLVNLFKRAIWLSHRERKGWCDNFLDGKSYVPNANASISTA